MLGAVSGVVVWLLVHPRLIVHPVFGKAFDVVAGPRGQLWMVGVNGAVVEDKDLGAVKSKDEVFCWDLFFVVAGVDEDSVFTKHPSFVHVMLAVAKDVTG